jgi:hypothetical protein
MKPVVGWDLGTQAFVGTSPQRGALGTPYWSPDELLRDLELRLGLPRASDSELARIPRWAARIGDLGDADAFYAESFAVDPLGTAGALLEWRDALVDAGWNGDLHESSSPRLHALGRIERHRSVALPAGRIDRLVAVQAELSSRPSVALGYEGLVLVEERALWSTRWKSVFALLEGQGTIITAWHASLPGAPADTDLGVLQRLLRGELPAGTDVPLRADGSLLMFRGDTLSDLAEWTAAAVGVAPSQTLVVRSLDPAPLEAAFARQGLASQGHASLRAARPATQVLSLVLELAYEPKDPYRVLELLTLPVGPFRGDLGRTLARAVIRQPGVLGQDWLKQKQRWVEAARLRKSAELAKTTEAASKDVERDTEAWIQKRLDFVRDWLEAEGAHDDRASAHALLDAAARVSAWMQAQLAFDEAGVYGAAYRQVQDFIAALADDKRAHLSREECRQLFDTVARVASRHVLCDEAAGRPHHVEHPGAILAPAPNVVCWNFVSAVERRPRVAPWNVDERAALALVGVAYAAPEHRLEVEAQAWRRAVLAAQQTLVLVVPGKLNGASMSPHSLWDEICARLGIHDARAEARITRHASATLLAGEGAVRGHDLTGLPLPHGHTAWTIDRELLVGTEEARTMSATALEQLASCPLGWVLSHRAKLSSGAVAQIAEGPLLNGNLSHRLVESLFLAGAFDLEECAFMVQAEQHLDQLVRLEGATLLLPGASFERGQLQKQVIGAMRSLFRYLAGKKFRIASVEESIEIQSAAGLLRGRIDVRLVDEAGADAVLDLKWGASSYRERLVSGRAVQLATYARGLKGKPGGSNVTPPAAYFALSSGQVLSADARMTDTPLDGPTMDETWAAVERTATRANGALAGGRVPVANTQGAPPLLDALGVPEAEHPRHFINEPEDTCKYCSFDTLCGRAWEAMS